MTKANGLIKRTLVCLSILTSLICPSVLGCWGTNSKSADLNERFLKSKYVVVAEAEAVTQRVKHRYQNLNDLIEDTRFRVIYRFKGDRELGQTLLSHTDLEFGCSVSALNNPVWLESVLPVRIPLNPDTPATPTKISGVWLIFADMEPFILDEQQHQPIERVSAADWLTLFRLSAKNTQLGSNY